ncbi:hypothetical protein ACFLW0_06495 [Chloroflexota bacterium]
MPQSGLIAMMVMSGVFILLGVGAIIWGRNEEKSYYDALSTRPDSREFMDHWPPRPQFGALKIGGRIAIIIGILLVLFGGAFWLWG